MPASWNGQLVVYARGINDPQTPIALPTDNASIAALATVCW